MDRREGRGGGSNFLIGSSWREERGGKREGTFLERSEFIVREKGGREEGFEREDAFSEEGHESRCHPSPWKKRRGKDEDSTGKSFCLLPRFLSVFHLPARLGYVVPTSDP